MNYEVLITPECFHCGMTGSIQIEATEYASGLAKREAGELIQYCFPSLSSGEREQVLTGTHPECWDEMFGKLDIDEEQGAE